MQQIVILALVGIVAITLSAGYLANDISVNTQEFGVGDGTIESPIDFAGLVLLIERTNPDSLIDFKDLIIECEFLLQQGEDIIPAGSTIFCKIVDEQGSLIAEGSIVLDADLDPTLGQVSVFIPITWLAFANANDINNFFDLIFVIQGPP